MIIEEIEKGDQKEGWLLSELIKGNRHSFEGAPECSSYETAVSLSSFSLPW